MSNNPEKGTTRESILRHLRSEPLASSLWLPLSGMSDEKIYRSLFINYRKGSKGLQLTDMGLRILRNYFKSYEIITPEMYRFGSRDLLYLDSQVKMPYFIDNNMLGDAGACLIVFEMKLAIMLKLADGMISNLREMLS